MWPFSRKQNLRETGVLDGWTDRHSHILPGVDDGIQTVKESIAVLNLYEQLGVQKVWLTPHIMEDVPNTPEKLHSRFDELKQAYYADGTAGRIDLHLAAENMMDSLFIKRLEDRVLMPYGDNHDELLVETSYVQPPMGMTDILREIQRAGFTPVLAHPERYFYMDEEKYENIKDMGVRFQLNITSLAGAYGHIVQQRAEYLLREGFYTYSGSDVHSYRSISHAIERKALKKGIVKTLQNYAFSK